jgi:hypothetical protein
MLRWIQERPAPTPWGVVLRRFVYHAQRSLDFARDDTGALPSSLRYAVTGERPVMLRWSEERPAPMTRGVVLRRFLYHAQRSLDGACPERSRRARDDTGARRRCPFKNDVSARGCVAVADASRSLRHPCPTSPLQTSPFPILTCHFLPLPSLCSSAR